MVLFKNTIKHLQTLVQLVLRNHETIFVIIIIIIIIKLKPLKERANKGENQAEAISKKKRQSPKEFAKFQKCFKVATPWKLKKDTKCNYIEAFRNMAR